MSFIYLFIFILFFRAVFKLCILNTFAPLLLLAFITYKIEYKRQRELQIFSKCQWKDLCFSPGNLVSPMSWYTHLVCTHNFHLIDGLHPINFSQLVFLVFNAACFQMLSKYGNIVNPCLRFKYIVNSSYFLFISMSYFVNESPLP